ncbi:dehydrogenase [Zobellella endophytica]|uniref:Dehydrogenase n=1 Tax=Zobellella endophytica TaxID=2116700 RepID=A0A2P7RAW3_9GAMM|nr:Gfo/Idh/MocA family oxidoreductase [Zobellella endophytica]PSJ47302.1 dehydrogenase [Zobellella endophytica]
MRFGVVGYGTGGQHFHTPFIKAARNCELVGIVARAPSTIAKVKADWPEVSIFPSLTAMIEAGVCDAVTITTPPATRRELVLEAIEAGLHVIADKPFAPDAKGGRELGDAARAKGVTLGVYQNRRFDSDLQTLRKLILDGRLGDIRRIESRMDQDSPETLEAGPMGGLLRDLGSHVVDQMLYLLGPVTSVDAQMDVVELAEGETDVSFTITLRHENGAHSHLSASKSNHIDCRELRAYGSLGSYVASSVDVQAQDIFAGKRPADNPETWGFEPESNWGTLYRAQGAVRVAAEQGRYHYYYEAFAEAVRTGNLPPVTAEAGAATLAILDAARQSAKEGRSISL